MYDGTLKTPILQQCTGKGSGKEYEECKKETFPREVFGEGGLGWSNKREQ